MAGSRPSHQCLSVKKKAAAPVGSLRRKKNGGNVFSDAPAAAQHGFMRCVE